MHACQSFCFCRHSAVPKLSEQKGSQPGVVVVAVVDVSAVHEGSPVAHTLHVAAHWDLHHAWVPEHNCAPNACPQTAAVRMSSQHVGVRVVFNIVGVVVVVRLHGGRPDKHILQLALHRAVHQALCDEHIPQTSLACVQLEVGMLSVQKGSQPVDVAMERVVDVITLVMVFVITTGVELVVVHAGRPELQESQAAGHA